MYVIDITREDDNAFNNDMMFGKKSSDTKEKIIDYVYDYALANCNMSLNKDALDQELDINYFSLKRYCFEKYGYDSQKELIIQSLPTENDKCIIVKSYNNKLDEKPIAYLFDKSEENKAKGLMAYMINEELINVLGNEERLDEYEKEKKDIHNFDDVSFSYGSKQYNYYNGGLFLEELLNNAVSYNQIKKNNKEIEI